MKPAGSVTVAMAMSVNGTAENSAPTMRKVVIRPRATRRVAGPANTSRTAAPIASRISAAQAGPTSGRRSGRKEDAAPQTAPRKSSDDEVDDGAGSGGSPARALASQDHRRRGAGVADRPGSVPDIVIRRCRVPPLRRCPSPSADLTIAASEPPTKRPDADLLATEPAAAGPRLPARADRRGDPLSALEGRRFTGRRPEGHGPARHGPDAAPVPAGDPHGCRRPRAARHDSRARRGRRGHRGRGRLPGREHREPAERLQGRRRRRNTARTDGRAGRDPRDPGDRPLVNALPRLRGR